MVARLTPDQKVACSIHQKTRSALHLLKSETKSERILDICRAAALTPDFHLDRRAFSLVVSKLAAAHNFPSIRTLVDDLKTRPDLCRNEKFLSHAIVLYGQANMLDHAIRTFAEDLPSPRSVKTLNSLLFASLLAKNYKELTRIYLEFPKTYSIQPNLDTYNIVIKAFAQSGSTSSF
ncbi:hypothetical protein GYH30_036853 [Glycine max]|uniref:Pentacotripeptide-repeat region of PRORP domain-containing protein n=1 Tax=Glycine max TaxID=3847 RepID=A0A0R0GZS0_SOYBN|nr:hypothetical protein GYH30_036853 [Glycine max]